MNNDFENSNYQPKNPDSEKSTYGYQPTQQEERGYQPPSNTAPSQTPPPPNVGSSVQKSNEQ